MTERARFLATGTVVLDGAGNSPTFLGNGAQFRPAGTGWEVDRITVAVSSRNAEALCRIYLDQVGDRYEVGRTYSGSSGDTNTDSIYVADGQALNVVWTGGDPGAVATVTVQGWKVVVQRGFRAVS